MYCPWSPNLAELDKCRPMVVKQSRIQKMLRWLINESKNSAHSAVSFDGIALLVRRTGSGPGALNPTSPASTAVSASTSTLASVWVAPQVSDRQIADGDGLVPDVVLANVVIPTGDAPLWEPSNEHVLSKLWPHLNSFGLVGFCVERDLKVSLDEQVKHFLNLYDSDFDATQVFRQLAFRVPKEKVARIAAALLEIDMDVVSEMIIKSKDTKRYKATTEAENHINRILAELQSAGDKIHGSTAQMLDMRNEIGGYVNAFGILGRIKDKFLDQADTV
ncbi:BQ5605_C004g02660 [Microbotryum silenes-dioicae]|uniref:BQ5605_C004g02660 protein n=1 Tax=Microbotryum silenes-dioicae TaxID=796604 RepID=A0A2X0M8D5_9BASI|nr:BQ5605_C004g02660 [Microbotryum silenes-dioicae]